MSRRPSLYGAYQTRSLFRSSIHSGGSGRAGELDLRNEFDQLLYGDDRNIRHGHLVVIRNLRRQPNGEPERCVCREKFHNEPDIDCPYCLGEGYYWDEKWQLVYSMYTGPDSGLTKKGVFMPPGEVRVEYKVFFLRYDVPITYGDKIIEMVLDTEGRPVEPYVRESIYKPQTINKYRLDDGRIEYIKIMCREDDAIRTDTPK